MAKAPKRAKAKKRDPANYRPTKDDQIRNLQIALEGMTKMREDANAACSTLEHRRSELTRERNQLAELLEGAKATITDLRAENARQLGYIQRVQEGDIVRSPRVQMGTITEKLANQECVTIQSRPVRTSTGFGQSIGDRAREHLAVNGQHGASKGYITDQERDRRERIMRGLA
jgi:hypothetical protein